jgi:membrane protease YdiL (CAAX protease family)
MDPFAVLGVDEDADRAEIKRAYRERLKEVHPDQGGSKEELERVRDAYETITAGDADTPGTTVDDRSDAVTPESSVDDPGTTGGNKLRALGVGVSVGVSGLLLGLVLTLGAVLLARAFVEIGDLELIVLSLLMTQGVGLGSAAVAYVSWRGVGLEYVSARLPDLADIAWIVAAYVVAIVGVVVVGIVLTLLNAPSANNQAAETATRSPEVLLILIPGSFLLIGPGEELLFRGVVQTRIREAFGPIPGVFLASLIFAAVHVVALVGEPEGILVTVGVLMVPSLILGAAYEYTENIVVPALIHGAYNATLFGLLYVSLRFGDGVSESAALFL